MTVAVVVVPIQPFAEGVMVKVTVIGAEVVLVSAPKILLPEPDAAIPVTVAVLLRVHVNVVPLTGLDSVMVLIASPEQMV